MDYAIFENNVLKVKFPNSAILFLRSNSSTPNSMKISVEFPNGKFDYEVPVLKVQNYSLEQIFSKNLLFLIPFYIFTHEKNFVKYNKDSQKLEKLLGEYQSITEKLENLTLSGIISEYEKSAIQAMSGNVIDYIAKKYSHVREGVKNIMVGKILDYEAKNIFNRGIAKGIAQGELLMLFKLVKNKILSLKDASQQANLSEAEFLKQMNLLKYSCKKGGFSCRNRQLFMMMFSERC